MKDTFTKCHPHIETYPGKIFFDRINIGPKTCLFEANVILKYLNSLGAVRFISNKQLSSGLFSQHIPLSHYKCDSQVTHYILSLDKYIDVKLVGTKLQ